MSVSSKASSESAILSALNANNPFERPPVVKGQNIWGESFPDVLTLNARASDSVFSALKKIQNADSSLEKVTSIVFTADRGVGKSHVIKRIRKRLQATSEGIFVYASADKYGDLNLINALFQQSIAESLEQQGGEGVTQWQEIAVLMVAEALRSNKASATVPSALGLVRKFDIAYQKTRAQGKDLVGDLT
ncbi:MAG: P-loop NTPase fold protein [Phormidesmis sp.]